MAGRVNTRFVILLAASLGILILGVVGFVVYQQLRSPARYIAMGEQLLGEDDAEAAHRQFGKAFHRETDPDRRIDILYRMVQALRETRPDSLIEAQQSLGQIQQYYTQALELEPTHRESANRLLEIRHAHAEYSPNSLSAWNRLYDQADEILRTMPDHEPARKYRAMAQVRLLMALQSQRDQDMADQAEQDLQQALSNDPEDAEVQYHAALWALRQANMAEQRGQGEQAAEQRDQALQRMRDFVAEHPDDLEGRLAQTRLTQMVARQRDDSQTLQQALTEQVNELEKRVREAGDIDAALDTVRHLVSVDREPITLDNGREATRGLRRALDLLTAKLEGQPDAIEGQLMKGHLLRQMGRFDDARAAYQKAAAEREIGVSLEVIRAVETRANAVQALGQITIALAESAESDERAEQYFQQAEQHAATLAELRGEDSGPVRELQGMIAMARGDYERAVKRLSAANNAYEGRSARVLNAYARAQRQVGNTGAAADALEQVMAVGGADNNAARLQLAELRLRAGETEQARNLAQQVLDAEPDNQAARVLLGTIMAMQASGEDPDRLNEAIAALEDADRSDRRVALQLGRLYLAGQQPERARAVLEAFFRDHPGDVQALQLLLRAERALGDPEAAAAHVRTAREADPDNTVLKLLERRLSGEDVDAADALAEVEQIISSDTDPVSRDLKRYQLYRQNEQPERAEEIFANLVEQHPDDERVMQLRFDRALREQNWQQAEQLVQRAGELNDGEGLDYAGGRLWRGRLLLAREQYEPATDTLERALEIMPSDARGWLMLGSAELALNNLSDAQRALQRSVDLKPDNFGAWVQLHVVHDRRGRHGQALEALRRAMRYQSNNPRLVARYIDYLGRHGDPAEAIRLRQQLLERNPDDQQNRRALVQLYLRNDQPDQARDLVDQLLAEAPDDPANLLTAARFYQQTGAVERGVALLREHIDSKGDSVQRDDWIMFARYLREVGQEQRAAAAYRRAMELDQSDRLQAAREMADWRFQRGEYQDALDLYERILDNAETDEDRLVVWRRYIETLLSVGSIQQAQRELVELQEQYPDDAQANLLRGLIAERLAEQDDITAPRRQTLLDEAERAYDLAVQQAPNEPIHYLQRARFRMQSDNELVRSLARDDLQRHLELAPDSRSGQMTLVQWHLRENQTSEATRLLRQMLVRNPGDTMARRQLAELHFANDNRRELDRLLRESRQLQPNNPMWPMMQARLAERRGDRSAVEAHYGEAFDLQPSGGGLLAYAEAMVVNGNHGRALELIDEYRDEVRQSPRMQAVRARALAGSADAGGSDQVFRRALDLAEGNAAAEAFVLDQLNALPVERQLALLDDATGGEPGSVQVELQRGQLELRRGAYQAAVDRLAPLRDRAADMDDRFAVPVFRALSQAYYALEQYPRARAMHEAVLARRPDDMTTLNNLAFMLAEDLDQPEAALQPARRAAELAEGNQSAEANVLDTLGRAQYLAGNLDAAETTLRRSVRSRALVANQMHLAEVMIARDRAEEARSLLNEARRMAEQRGDRKSLDKVNQLLRTLDATAAGITR